MNTNNPLAFPKTVDGTREQQDGMTLRDWFAGMALQGYTASLCSEYKCRLFTAMAAELGKSLPETLSHMAYVDADAMLAQRNKS